ncbi:MAG: L7Ae/L30e/S12e/Gadd45 family ribosomal protein [Longimicrobiales bacterium]
MEGRSRRSEALALLGLAQRAGAVVKGTDATRSAIRKGIARLVILAADGSRPRQDKVLPLARARGVPWVRLGSMSELGGALGTGPLAVVAVTGSRIAGEIRMRVGSD